MREYLVRLDRLKAEYLMKEAGASVAPRAFARQMLPRSGLSKFDQRAVLTKTEGKWDAVQIRSQLETIYKNVESHDKHVVKRGRNFRNGLRKTFIASVTDLEPDDVEVDGDEDPLAAIGNEKREDHYPSSDGYSAEDWSQEEWDDWNSYDTSEYPSPNGSYINGYGSYDSGYDTNTDKSPMEQPWWLEGYDGEDGFWYDGDERGCTDMETGETFGIYFGTLVNKA